MIRTLLALLILTPIAHAEPIATSWFTEYSGQYARIYPTTAEESANTPVTTWNHPNGGSSQPVATYAGVSEVSTTDTDLYIRTSGLAFHVMGPWYGGNGNLFPNYPANIARTARFPLTPEEANMPKPLTGLGAIGYFVDGVAMFDSRDAFSYISDQMRDSGPVDGQDIGDDVWNRDAYVNESDTFDPAFAHQAGATHHYHANPPGLRHLLGDSVNYDSSSNSYTEVPSNTHSPILAWTFDGFPLYGPYGYSDPLDSNSGVRRMISGYQMRDGSNGSTNLAAVGRTTLPTWITRNEDSRINPLATNQYGPVVNATYTLGHYLEDYAYKGDLGMTLGIDFDLNEYNVRWCVTPDFPTGTWAYFSCIAADGTPVFPYNISRYYFGTVQGANNVTIPATANVVWEGGPEAALETKSIEVDSNNGDVTITWSTVEGGQYLIESSDLEEPWEPVASPLADGSSTTIIDSNRGATDPSRFYRAEFQYLAPFDDNGYAYDNAIVSEGPQNNVLLLILDDWGIDSSALYNEEPGAQLADMPNLEALGGAVALGLDENYGHVQPTGKYHYHGLPTGYLKDVALSSNKHSPIVGWAFDGFPVYALYGYLAPTDPTSKVIEMTSSYRLKSGERPAPPEGPGGTYDGAFTDDYEYVAGSGTLDECNGCFVKTPEFPEGTYAYFLTNQWPVIFRNYRGTPAIRPERGPGGPLPRGGGPPKEPQGIK